MDTERKVDAEALQAIGRNRQQIEDALNSSSRKGVINLIYNQYGDFGIVSLVSGRGSGSLTYFAQVRTKHIKVKDLGPGPDHHLLIIQHLDALTVLNEIGNLIGEHYPAVNHIPINLYASRREFLRRNHVKANI